MRKRDKERMEHIATRQYLNGLMLPNKNSQLFAFDDEMSAKALLLMRYCGAATEQQRIFWRERKKHIPHIEREKELE